MGSSTTLSLFALAALLPHLASAMPLTSLKPRQSSWPKIPFGARPLYDLNNIGMDVSTVSASDTGAVNPDVVIVDGAGIVENQGLAATYAEKNILVMCYFSAGTIESYRTDMGPIDPSCYCGPGNTWDKENFQCSSSENKMNNWDEYYLDIHDPTCYGQIQGVMTQRMKDFKGAGCDGVDPDNVDAHGNPQKLGIDATDEKNYLKWLAETAHNNGLAITLKNAGDLIDEEIVDLFDMSVLETCGDCSRYSDFLDAEKPQLRTEYGRDPGSCDTLPKGVHVGYYSEDQIDTGLLTRYCGAESSGEVAGGAINTGSSGGNSSASTGAGAGAGASVSASSGAPVPTASGTTGGSTGSDEETSGDDEETEYPSTDDEEASTGDETPIPIEGEGDIGDGSSGSGSGSYGSDEEEEETEEAEVSDIQAAPVPSATGEASLPVEPTSAPESSESEDTEAEAPASSASTRTGWGWWRQYTRPTVSANAKYVRFD